MFLKYIIWNADLKSKMNYSILTSRINKSFSTLEMDVIRQVCLQCKLTVAGIPMIVKEALHMWKMLTVCLRFCSAKNLWASGTWIGGNVTAYSYETVLTVCCVSLNKDENCNVLKCRPASPQWALTFTVMLKNVKWHAFLLSEMNYSILSSKMFKSFLTVQMDVI